MQFLTPDVFFSVLLAVVASVCWIEKRFRDSRKELDMAMREEERRRTNAIDTLAASYRDTATRIELQITTMSHKVGEFQLQVLRDLRDYPTKEDIAAMLEPISAQLETFERRFESAMGIPRRTP